MSGYDKQELANPGVSAVEAVLYRRGRLASVLVTHGRGGNSANRTHSVDARAIRTNISHYRTVSGSDRILYSTRLDLGFTEC